MKIEWIRPRVILTQLAFTLEFHFIAAKDRANDVILPIWLTSCYKSCRGLQQPCILLLISYQPKQDFNDYWNIIIFIANFNNTHSKYFTVSHVKLSSWPNHSHFKRLWHRKRRLNITLNEILKCLNIHMFTLWCNIGIVFYFKSRFLTHFSILIVGSSFKHWI